MRSSVRAGRPTPIRDSSPTKLHQRYAQLSATDDCLGRRPLTEAQIVSILREYDAGAPIAELARKHGVHANTLRLWKSKDGGLDVSDLMRLKQLEDEKSRMRRVIDNLTLENDAMKRAGHKKLLGPSRRKEAVKALKENGLSERAACRLARCPRRTAQYRSRRAPDDPALIENIKTIAEERPRFGRRRLRIFVFRHGFRVSERRFNRIYRAGTAGSPSAQAARPVFPWWSSTSGAKPERRVVSQLLARHALEPALVSRVEPDG